MAQSNLPAVGTDQQSGPRRAARPITQIDAVRTACPSPKYKQPPHAKLTLILLMAAVHGLYAKWRKVFERDENTKPAKFYKIWNEVPTLLMIIIVLLAVVKPF